MENQQDQKPSNEKEIERNLEDIQYPPQEDIYNNEAKLENINPENITTENTINQEEEPWVENAFKNNETDKMGGDLDVPGSELDDQQENIGSEDEENNYYSESDN